MISCNPSKEREDSIAGKPNIIFIYADDLGRGLLGVNGQKVIETPNIDKLAEQRISFKNSYGCAYCLPSRASLLTGLHDCHSNGWNYVPGGIWIDYRDGKYSYQEVVDSIDKSHFPIPDEELFLPQLLKKAGYYPRSLFRNGKEVFFEGNTSADGKTKGPYYSQELFLKDILEFIRKQPKHEPFFLYHPSQIPHGDVMIPEIHPDFMNDERLTKTQKEYASMVKMLDDQVGIIMNELEVQGIADNTIVIFSVDNGHDVYYELDHQKCYDKSKSILSDKFDTERDGDVFNGNGNLSGKKFSTWEGGLRVPLIIKWPGKIKPGSTTSLLVSNYDLMPTLAELTGVEMPGGKDGLSYLPALLGKPDQQKKHNYILYRGKVRYARRQGAALITADGWKLRYFERDEVYMLHDLASDPKEDHDLALQYPEKLDELKNMFEKEYNSPRRDIN